MKKHNIILNISCNKLIFWLNYYKHVNALENLFKVIKLQQSWHAIDSIVKNALNNENKLNFIDIVNIMAKLYANQNIIKKSNSLELLLHMLSIFKNVNKIVVINDLAYIISKIYFQSKAKINLCIWSY